MALLDRLTSGPGSVLSTGNGATPPTNIGATTLSKLHADNTQPHTTLITTEFLIYYQIHHY